jgi:type IV pilus assembly protein PilO
MFKKVPYYGQVIIFLGIALGIIAVAYWIYPNLAEDREEISRLEEEYSDKERKILEGQAIEQRLPEFVREIAELQQKLEDVQQILPTNRETGDLLRWIKNLGDQSNLDLKSFSPGKLKPVEFYKEFPIEMQVVTRYHDLGVFLDRVSKYSRIINVDDLKMNSAEVRDKTIRANFTATTFVYDDEGEAEEDIQ